MNQKALLFSGLLGIALIAGMLTFAFLWKVEHLALSELQQTPPAPVIEKKTQPAAPALSGITATHSFDSKKSTHTLAGDFPSNVPCSAVTYSILSENAGMHVRVIFEEHILPEQSCTDVKALRAFSISFVAPEDTVIESFLLDTAVPLIISKETATTT